MPKEIKLLTILPTLSRKEMTYFREFVDSPYFNKHERLKQLAGILSEVYPDFDSPALKKNALFKELFPREKFNAQKLMDLFSYLQELFENFMAHNHLYDNELIKKELRVTAYEQKALTKHIPRELAEYEQLLEARGLRDGSYHRQVSVLNEFRDHYQSSVDSRNRTTHLQTKTDAFDVHYLTTKLRDCCEMLNRKNIVNVDFQPRFIDELLRIIETNEWLYETPVISIYYRLYHTLKESDKESHYYELMTLLRTHYLLFEEEEAKMIYDYARNYCIKKINSGNSKFAREIFELYRELVDNKLIYRNGEMTQWDYKNIVTVGLRLNEIDWTNNFIHHHKKFLPTQDAENAFNYNLASLYHATKDYHQAAKLLTDVEFTDVYYALSARSLLLKIFYEQQDDEPLSSLVESFKTYLKRNKNISTYQKLVHLNLIRFTAGTARLRAKKNYIRPQQFKTEYQKLQEKIESTPQITNTEWLKEIVGALA